MIRRGTIPLLILLIAGLSGCSKESPPPAAQTPAQAPVQTAAQNPPAPAAAAPAAAAPAAAAPAPEPALKTEDTNLSGVTVDATDCSRKDGVLSVKLRFHNGGSERKQLAVIESRGYERYYVTAGSKKYFILKDSEGTYLTPQADGFGNLSVWLEPGAQYTWWAKFPAPPADVKAVTLYLPTAAPLEDLPVSDR